MLFKYEWQLVFYIGYIFQGRRYNRRVTSIFQGKGGFSKKGHIIELKQLEFMELIRSSESYFL